MVAVVLSTTGCATWWSNFKKDPIAQVQSIISTLETVVTIATVIFGEVKPALPEAKREEAQRRFTNAVLAVEAAKRALRDGLATAEAAHEDPPNVAGAIQGALKSAEDLRTLVRELQAMVRVSAPNASAVALPPTKPDDLDAAVEGVRKFQR
jgi:hypothetical protein